MTQPRARVAAPLGLRVESVLDASPNPTLAVDADGRIVYASPNVQEAFGWSADELRGAPIERLVPPRLAERHMGQRSAFAAHPSARPMGSGLELTGRRRDGTEFPAEISLAPLSSPRGDLVLATVVDITARVTLRAQLAQAHGDLRRRADELEQRGQELSLLAQLGERLESCQTQAEAYGVIGRVAEALFAGDAGALYVLDPSRTEAVAVAAWGSPQPARGAFPATDCWALRRGQLHVVQDGEPELRCPHVEETSSRRPPLRTALRPDRDPRAAALQVRKRPTAGAPAARLADRERLLGTLGRQVALALANIRLRETLREQSSRDALTGLFNRRSMEDALGRELRRAAREGYGLGLLLADLDHFKDLNDAFGHAAGDAVLREIGRYLAGAVRGADVACRYGGEEFVILLPKASLADTQRRAEALRDGLKVHQAAEPLRLYPSATMSIGVAAYPEHGSTADALLLAADSAMYRAKALGRDRVVVAGDSERRPIEVSAG